MTERESDKTGVEIFCLKLSARLLLRMAFAGFSAFCCVTLFTALLFTGMEVSITFCAGLSCANKKTGLRNIKKTAVKQNMRFNIILSKIVDITKMNF